MVFIGHDNILFLERLHASDPNQALVYVKQQIHLFIRAMDGRTIRGNRYNAFPLSL